MRSIAAMKWRVVKWVVDWVSGERGQEKEALIESRETEGNNESV